MSLWGYTGSTEYNPNARKYILNFQNNKIELLSILFKLFNETVFDNKIPDNINFKWNTRLRSSAGICYNKQSLKVVNNVLTCVRLSDIAISSKIVTSPDRLRDVLIHELCHAASWIIDVCKKGHGPVWKKWTNKAMKVFPKLPAIKTNHRFIIPSKYIYQCIECNYSFQRHKKSVQNLPKKRCGFCFGKLKLIINKEWDSPNPSQIPIINTIKESDRPDYLQMKAKYSKDPTEFGVFVIMNYIRLKRKHRKLNHAEVIKLLESRYIKILNSKKATSKRLR